MTIEAMDYVYPDTFDKMVMNELVVSGFMSSKDYGPLEYWDTVEFVLDDFVTAGYVTKDDAVFNAVDNATYTVYSVTPFFLQMIQAQRDYQREQELVKLALWEQRQHLLSQMNNTRLRGATTSNEHIASAMDEVNEIMAKEKERMVSELDSWWFEKE
jgi:hypothetical protein